MLSLLCSCLDSNRLLHHDPSDRNRAAEEQKRIGWEMTVRIEKILCTVLHQAHERQVEETIDTLSKGPERFYKSYRN